MKMKICIVTGTRAEYGLLLPLIRKMQQDDFFELKVAVTGTHLSSQFGNTVEEIENDGIIIDKKIEILMDSKAPSAVSKSMGLALIEFGVYFAETTPDLVIVLGDRYEILAVTCAAVTNRRPVAHIHGGEVTEGAYDEFFRHAISKMSILHFTSCNEHRNRVIQLGEYPDRVFNVGAIGLENIRELPLLTLDELEKSLNTKLDGSFGLVTYHPVTLEAEDGIKHLLALLNTICKFREMKFIFTMANADHGGIEINEMLKRFAKDNPEQILLFSNLGQLRYLSAMKYASCVIGNSSSGIIEAPGFLTPTVNIGERQKGRVRAASVIDCNTEEESIHNAINLAISPEFKESLGTMLNPYGDGFVSDQILQAIRLWFNKGDTNMKKAFYDLNIFGGGN